MASLSSVVAPIAALFKISSSVGDDENKRRMLMASNPCGAGALFWLVLKAKIGMLTFRQCIKSIEIAEIKPTSYSLALGFGTSNAPHDC